MRTPAIILAYLASGFAFAADTPKLVVVASYRNTPDLVKTVGARVVSILKEHGIQSVQVGSFGMSVDVSEDHAPEALRLLAKAILAEKLDLSLMVKKGDGSESVAPESILAPKTEK